MNRKKHLVALTGAGISAESGVPTFRDANGLWMGYDIEKVASIGGWQEDPKTVLEFYNKRRREAGQVKPNAAHQILADLQKDFRVSIITQNVDDLHERAGSKNVLHLHGELFKMRSEKCSHTPAAHEIYDIRGDIRPGDLAPDGGQLRPHIVWFGELVPMIFEAEQIAATADIFVVVGTSLQVYPAAGLIYNVPANVPKYIIDKTPPSLPQSHNFHVIEKGASEGMKELKSFLNKNQ